MSSGNPLGALAEAARVVEQNLRRAIAAANEEWKDSARRSFDAQYLTRIEAEVREMTDELVTMAERLQKASGLLAARG